MDCDDSSSDSCKALKKMELKEVYQLKEANSANKTRIHENVDDILDHSKVNVNTIDLNKNKRRRIESKVTDFDDQKLQTKFNETCLNLNLSPVREKANNSLKRKLCDL